jgi:hypothetical protein
MDVADIAIERITVEDLRADKSGVLIEQIGSLAYRAFREPPWNDDLERPRLSKLGFEELPVRDAVFPDRTYWLLAL